MSLRKAGEKYGIPFSSIKNWILSEPKLVNGGQTALSNDIESELIEVLKIASDWAYPFESLDVRLLVQKYLKANHIRIAKFVDDLPGVDGFYGFLKRHKNEISMKKSQNIKRSRADVDSNQIVRFFDQLKMSMEGISAANIINYDETNITDDPGSVKVISRRSSKHTDRVIDASKTNTSVMFSGTASGVNLPPYVVYKSTHLNDTWTDHGPPGTIYNRSSSSWSTWYHLQSYKIIFSVLFYRTSSVRLKMNQN